MLVRLSRAPVLSGGLRRKTQLFSGTLYMAASSKTPPHQSKGPQKFKTRSKCQFSQGAVRCVIIPIVKTLQTQLHSTQSWSATGLRGRKIKIIS
ncbi:hypothetical protein TNCV_19581 [Trichonephila clavipes]|nr:hypothetical protein TNCV_3162061 [Trichonephila clavipes]GFU18608.1 hypothetical protein TNCV_1805891 [Trichonephila clavipes]GFV77806.1 hypothetical protein TNCV_4674001 [Trichonephila clavipes]GFW95727.1 hypothetical protein TNCV_19581 [Trichonephila clavipes]